MFAHLDAALACVTEFSVDLVVSTRAQDAEAIRQCLLHRPKHVANLEINEVKYNAQWNGDYHHEAVLVAICMQRNNIRNLALARGHDWLFFLDSDIHLQPTTLRLLLDTQLSCVGAPYMPRWSNHVVVGVVTNGLAPPCSLSL